MSIEATPELVFYEACEDGNIMAAARALAQLLPVSVGATHRLRRSAGAPESSTVEPKAGTGSVTLMAEADLDPATLDTLRDGVAAACTYGHEAVVRLLLRHSRVPDAAFIPHSKPAGATLPEDGRVALGTAAARPALLHYACSMQGDPHCVALLLASGRPCEPNATGPLGRTALMWAVESGRADLASAVLRDPRTRLRQRDEEGMDAEELCAHVHAHGAYDDVQYEAVLAALCAAASMPSASLWALMVARCRPWAPLATTATAAATGAGAGTGAGTGASPGAGTGAKAAAGRSAGSLTARARLEGTGGDGSSGRAALRGAATEAAAAPAQAGPAVVMAALPRHTLQEVMLMVGHAHAPGGD